MSNASVGPGINSITVVGEVYKHPASMRKVTGSEKQYLHVWVSYTKTFGTGNTFTEHFRVVWFSPSAAQILKDLRPGTLVCVSGEVGIEQPIPDKIKQAILKINARDIKILGAAAVNRVPDSLPEDEARGPYPQQQQQQPQSQPPGW